MYYREETVKHYFCARCGKELRKSKEQPKPIEYIEMYGIDDNAIRSPYERDGFYLCGRCTKEFKLFLKNKYPTDYKDLICDLKYENERLRNSYTEELAVLKQVWDYASLYSKYFMDTIETEIFKSQHQPTREQIEIENLFKKLMLGNEKEGDDKNAPKTNDISSADNQ